MGGMAPRYVFNNLRAQTPSSNDEIRMTNQARMSKRAEKDAERNNRR